MKKRKRKNAPGAGRPPAGVAGEKSSTYPKVRIEPKVLARLKALADERGVPIWQVMTEAGEKLLRSGKRQATSNTAPSSR